MHGFLIRETLINYVRTVSFHSSGIIIYYDIVGAVICGSIPRCRLYII